MSRVKLGEEKHKPSEQNTSHPAPPEGKGHDGEPESPHSSAELIRPQSGITKPHRSKTETKGHTTITNVGITPSRIITNYLDTSAANNLSSALHNKSTPIKGYLDEKLITGISDRIIQNHQLFEGRDAFSDVSKVEAICKRLFAGLSMQTLSQTDFFADGMRLLQCNRGEFTNPANHNPNSCAAIVVAFLSAAKPLKSQPLANKNQYMYRFLTALDAIFRKHFRKRLVRWKLNTAYYNRAHVLTPSTDIKTLHHRFGEKRPVLDNRGVIVRYDFFNLSNHYAPHFRCSNVDLSLIEHDISNSNFDHSLWEKLHLNYYTLNKVSFRNSHWHTMSVNKCRFNQVNFSNATLNQVTMIACIFKQVNFSHVDFRQINWGDISTSRFFDCQFNDCIFSPELIKKLVQSHQLTLDQVNWNKQTAEVLALRESLKIIEAHTHLITLISNSQLKEASVDWDSYPSEISDNKMHYYNLNSLTKGHIVDTSTIRTDCANPSTMPQMIQSAMQGELNRTYPCTLQINGLAFSKAIQLNSDSCCKFSVHESQLSLAMQAGPFSIHHRYPELVTLTMQHMNQSTVTLQFKRGHLALDNYCFNCLRVDQSTLTIQGNYRHTLSFNQARFSGTAEQPTTLSGHFKNTQFNSCLAEYTTFEGDYRQANFSASSAAQTPCQMTHCQLQGDFTDANFNGAKLAHCILGGTQAFLCGANSSLAHADLTGSTVSHHASLIDLIISDVDLNQLDWSSETMAGFNHTHYANFMDLYKKINHSILALPGQDNQQRAYQAVHAVVRNPEYTDVAQLADALQQFGRNHHHCLFGGRLKSVYATMRHAKQDCVETTLSNIRVDLGL